MWYFASLPSRNCEYRNCHARMTLVKLVRKNIQRLIDCPFKFRKKKIVSRLAIVAHEYTKMCDNKCYCFYSSSDLSYAIQYCRVLKLTIFGSSQGLRDTNQPGQLTRSNLAELR